MKLTKVSTAELYSEIARRRAAQRKVKRGGGTWSFHKPDYPRCLCVACNDIRRRAKFSASLKSVT